MQTGATRLTSTSSGRGHSVVVKQTSMEGARRVEYPAWMKTGPAMVRFGRSCCKARDIELWLREYSGSSSGPGPWWRLLGLEKVDSWVTPTTSRSTHGREVHRARLGNAQGRLPRPPWPCRVPLHADVSQARRRTFEWDDRQRSTTWPRPRRKEPGWTLVTCASPVGWRRRDRKP